MLHENKVKKNWWKNKDIRSLFIEIFIIAIIITSMSVFLSLIVSYFFNYPIDSLLIFKVFLITILDVILLIIILFFVSIFAGIYYYKKKEDPNNFLIPITTSIADFGNMVILAVLIIIFF